MLRPRSLGRRVSARRTTEANAHRVNKIAHLDGGSVKTYLEMIRVMDEGIGRVLAALDEIGARENTLIVFSSDNGGERFSDAYPLVGKKMDLLEGGIRVPYIVRWTATFLAAAGVSPHPDYPLDGIDLFGGEVERNLYWRMVYRNQKAVRSGVRGGAVLIGMHWLLAALALHVNWVGPLVKGHPVLLIKDGQVQQQGMRQAGLSEHDLTQALRMQNGHTDPAKIRLAYLERNGNISVIPFKGEPRVVGVSVADGVQTVRIELE